MGQRKGMSTFDVIKLNILYRCSEEAPDWIIITETNINTGVGVGKLPENETNVNKIPNKVTGANVSKIPNKIIETSINKIPNEIPETSTGTSSNKNPTTGHGASEKNTEKIPKGIETGTNTDKVKETIPVKGIEMGTNTDQKETNEIGTNTDKAEVKVPVKGIEIGTNTDEVEEKVPVKGVAIGTNTDEVVVKVPVKGVDMGTNTEEEKDTNVEKVTEQATETSIGIETAETLDNETDKKGIKYTDEEDDEELIFDNENDKEKFNGKGISLILVALNFLILHKIKCFIFFFAFPLRYCPNHVSFTVLRYIKSIKNFIFQCFFSNSKKNPSLYRQTPHD